MIKKFKCYSKEVSHNNISVFVTLVMDFYELPKDTITRKFKSIIHHIITNSYCNVESIHRQLCSRDLKIHEFKNFCHDVWLKDYNFITIDLD